MKSGGHTDGLLVLALDMTGPEIISSGRIRLEFWPRPAAGVILFYPGSMLAPGHYRVLLAAFHQAGFAVAGIHLPGHGLRRKESRFTFDSLLEAGLESEALLLKQGFKNIAIAGHSQGGILGLAHIAESQIPQAAFLIDAVYPDLELAISLTRFAPLAMWRDSILSGLSNAAKLLPGLPVPLPAYLQLRKIVAGKKCPILMGADKGRISYPLGFLVSLFAKKIPRRVHCPVTLFGAINDALFSEELVAAVFGEIDADDKELCWLPDGGHTAPLNPDLASYIARAAAERCMARDLPLSLGSA